MKKHTTDGGNGISQCTNRTLSDPVLIIIIHVLCFIQGGIYVFQLLDYYGCNGACLLSVALAECVAIGWAFGRFYLPG